MTVTNNVSPSETSTAVSASQTKAEVPLEVVDAWWRAANYLSVGQIYLYGNPLLKEPLSNDHIKPRLLGHWGTTPGLNLVWAHTNKAIVERGINSIYIAGPGHGGPGVVANAWLEGTYSELYPRISNDEAGVERLFRQFSFPGGIPSHASPEAPGSIHEGGELGYALAHAYGTVLDNPDLIATTVVGDGEAETGPLAASWHLNKFINPLTDGTVLPILHLNGYKIANPTVLARISEEELLNLFKGYGYNPILVSGGFDGEDHLAVHQRYSEAYNTALDQIAEIKQAAANGNTERPRWPLIILRTPKGWTGPREVDGVPVENTWRSHQVPLANVKDTPAHLKVLEDWLKSYRPEELFAEDGSVSEALAPLRPTGDLRLSANPHANGGLLLKELELPDFKAFAIDPGKERGAIAEATKVLGKWLNEVVKANPENFRIFGPDETASNRLDGVYDSTGKQWYGEVLETDEHLVPSGRVIEILSEHLSQGLLEGYLLTGRHGLFTSYEAFIHIVDSMFNQHAKWLESTQHIEWRRPIASFNYLLSSHVWRQDHNGFSHQDPGFIDHVVTKDPSIVRVYLPADANTLLSVYDHALRSKNYVNLVVAGKQPQQVWLTIDEAIEHNTRGLGIWDWAGTEVPGEDPDVVLAAAGDVPTVEALAAAKILRKEIPNLKVRVVNVVDLFRLQDSIEHPHGLTHDQFDQIFTKDKPVIFAYHGYPTLIHRLTYRRNNHSNIHVRGFKDRGTTTTPFDMLLLNDLDRFQLAIDVIKHVPSLGSKYATLAQRLEDERISHKQYTRDHGEDAPDITQWSWSDNATGSAAAHGDTGGDNI